MSPVALLTIAFIVLTAILVAAATAFLARAEGARTPTLITRAGIAFGATLTLAAVIATACADTLT
ncbi:hypothetical protein ACFQ77_06655 [Streptomyces virginiae]|uniref:hypothetical protein n=1 Tax=Streptomyces virginiae TaxID=1961 RepID=UPI0036756C88